MAQALPTDLISWGKYYTNDDEKILRGIDELTKSNTLALYLYGITVTVYFIPNSWPNDLPVGMPGTTMQARRAMPKPWSKWGIE